MTDASTQQITKIVKEMKLRWKIMYSDFLEKGFIPQDKVYDIKERS